MNTTKSLLLTLAATSAMAATYASTVVNGKHKRSQRNFLKACIRREKQRQMAKASRRRNRS